MIARMAESLVDIVAPWKSPNATRCGENASNNASVETVGESSGLVSSQAEAGGPHQNTKQTKQKPTRTSTGPTTGGEKEKEEKVPQPTREHDPEPEPEPEPDEPELTGMWECLHDDSAIALTRSPLAPLPAPTPTSQPSASDGRCSSAGAVV